MLAKRPNQIYNRSTCMTSPRILSLVLMAIACAANVHAQSLLVRGGTLIDGTGRAAIQNAEILIRDGLIAEIRTGGGVERSAGVEVVEAGGKFIIPGLIDSHVHYGDTYAELFLAHGVTTVGDLGNPHQWQVALKKGLNSGRMVGPRYLFCGETALAGNEAAPPPSVQRRGLDTLRKPEDAPAIVKRLKDDGADCIKLNEEYSGEPFSAMAQAAHASGLKVISHSFNAADSVRWGIDGIEHMVGIAVSTAASPRAKEAVGRLQLEAGHKNSSLYQWMEPAQFDGLIQDLVRRGVFINPTLAFEWKALSERRAQHEQEDTRLLNTPALAYFDLDDRLVSLGQYHWADNRSAEEIRQFKDGYRKVQQFLARFVQAGGKIYAGTDSAAATTPGLTLHHEMELLVDAGISPMHAIQAATKNGAEILGLDSRLGSIEKGKIADLVLLDANPLENIGNTKKIFRVIQNGRIIDTSYHADYQIPIKRPGPETKHLYNPLPQLRDVVPPVAIQGEAVSLRILGRAFTPNSVVKFDGHALQTRWISPGELNVSLDPSQTARVGTFLITVETPKPAGGLSEPVELLVIFK
jgi:imidazolonepropionase-like amidohydrolase